MIEERRRVPDSENKGLSLEIFNKVEQLEIFQNAKNILLFWSIKNEVYTHDFIKKWLGKKSIFLPVTLKEELKIREYKGKMKLIKRSTITLSEPTDGPYIDINDIDLVIVPGLAFDLSNNRLGYGKGYYDKLLKGTRAYKAGVCFSFQLLATIPATEQDQKMDIVITS